MAKDPAFLFYPGDWLGGTQLFSRHHKGCYMDILMAQFANGHLSIADIQTILGETDFNACWDSKLKAKFKLDGDGLYYNEKLENEIVKRKKFVGSRAENLSGSKEKTTTHKHSHIKNHMGVHMENGNENVIRKKNKIKGGVGEKQNFAPEIINYLNELNGTNFRTDTKATCRLIDQRIGEGYTVQELKEIVEYKIAEWKGTDQEKWLQPDTLFNGEKCAKYQNQVQAAKDKGMSISQIKGKGKVKPDMDELIKLAHQKSQFT